MKSVITVVGKDRIGIIAGVRGILAQHSVNILDISQTTMQDMFTMIMLVDISGCDMEFSDLADKLEDYGKGAGLDVRISHEDIYNSMHRI